jgi:type IV pilus assembly protein PilC
MGMFSYTAKDKLGQSVNGILDANSEAEAASILHEKELIVVSIELEKNKALKGREGGIKLYDLVIFSRQLATMIESGIPLVQSLTTLTEQIENKKLKEVALELRQDIQEGTSFCNALAKHPKVFSELFINMTMAGEASGTLDEVLDRLASYLEKAESLNRKIRTSLVYPEVVIVMAVLITSVLLIKVVPTFKGIFEMLGGTLPLATRILIGASDVLRKYFLFVIGLLVIFGFIFKKYINTEKGRYNFDSVKLKIPVLGILFRKVALAKFSRTFSTLIRSGVSILSALDIVARTSGNKVVEGAILNCRTAVQNGEPISRPLSKSGVFPPMVYRMIDIGEQTGQLEKMLSKIADFYDEQVDAQVAGLTSMIEPLVIAFLGVVVGGIVISLFLPIFKISELVAR